MALKDLLHWRYATKSYNGETVAQEKIDSILEAIRLAPSSSGLQPFKVFIITDPEVKAQLQPICFNQQLISQASHLLIFAAWDEYRPEQVNAFFEYSNTVRNLPDSATDDYRLALLDSFTDMSKEQQYFNASQQCYLALGFALLAAAELGVDATPIEGFDSQAVNAFLKLPEQGLSSSVLMALGYRDTENDWLVKLEKVRRNKEDMFVTIV